MSEHTPGPWTFDALADLENEPCIYTAEGAWVAECQTDAADDEFQIVANARLIAAAPDLLAACEATINAVSEHPDRPWWWDEPDRGGIPADQLYEAIAKAKGEVL